MTFVLANLDQIKAMKRREGIRAANIIGTGAVVFLGWEDAYTPDLVSGDRVRELADLIVRVRADLIITHILARRTPLRPDQEYEALPEMTIEDIVLSRDKRGISALRKHLPADFCHQAAALIPDRPGTAIIITGFYILAAQSNETDGPPGAIAVGMALRSLGYEVVHVSDRYTAPLMAALADDGARVVDFPIVDDQASRGFALDLLKELDPSVVISTERCGLTDEGLYRNMRGQDISEYTARVDHLFLNHPNTIGVGDGGNALGMGNLAEHIPNVPTLVKKPCVVRSTRPIICSVSNWGCYGLIAALSSLRKRNVLPSIEVERGLVERCVEMGSVDGQSHRVEPRVDGFTLEENSQALVELHELLAQEGL